MKSLFVGVARGVFNGAYRFQCKRRNFQRQKTAVFISRQMDIPSENFRAVGAALKACDWEVVYHTRRLTKKTLIPYTAHVLQEIALLSQASAVILDRYDPVVSLLDFECEAASSEVLESKRWVHDEYPTHPVVIQLWHAFGSFKKFGYQSLDTPEGHSSSTARIFRIHRNYSWVVCTSEDDRRVFAEAFSLSPDRVVPLGLPEFDKLLERRSNTNKTAGHLVPDGSHEGREPRPLRVFFAPTLRKSSTTEHPFHDLEAWWQEHGVRQLEPSWSYHPLERGVGAATDVALGLEEADVVVTDYSSLVYEAYVLGKPVLFYVPDIGSYRVSPGLNADPMLRCPVLCYEDPVALQNALLQLASNKDTYPQEALESFVGKGFSEECGQSAQRIAQFIDEKVR